MDGNRHFIGKTTLQCIQDGCVACLYKAFPCGKQSMSESAQERLSTATVPYPTNTRPENCLRVKGSTYNGMQSLKKKMLVVGDGDFSFSLSIAHSDPLRAAKRLAVTSYDTEEAFCSIYATSRDNLSALRQMGVSTQFSVDATHLTASLVVAQYDVILWNFPCVCDVLGADGQSSELAANCSLVSAFFANISSFLSPAGEVHLTHKTIEPFSWWDIPALAAKEGYRLAGDVVFDKCRYPGYTNRKALDKKSFTCNDAKVTPYATAIAACCSAVAS